ncbi:LysR family transcriptional regulator [Streptomyces avidinii]
MLDLARLRALHAVSVHGSVAAAAAALGYTPSAVSQQISKLERETRTTLLERRGRGVALTEEAHHLADTAQELLAIVERAETTLEERRGQPGGLLTVAAFASAARGLLPEVLADLARRYPALDVRLTEVDPHLSVELVARGVTDLAVAHDWDIAPLPAPEGIEQAVIGDDLCDLVVPAGHPFTTRRVIRRSDLGGERWVCQPPGRVCHDWLVRTLRTAGFEPDVAHVAEENQHRRPGRGRTRGGRRTPAGHGRAAAGGGRGTAGAGARTPVVRPVADRGGPAARDAEAVRTLQEHWASHR